MGLLLIRFFFSGVVRENVVNGRNGRNELSKLNAFVGRVEMATSFNPSKPIKLIKPKNLE